MRLVDNGMLVLVPASSGPVLCFVLHTYDQGRRSICSTCYCKSRDVFPYHIFLINFITVPDYTSQHQKRARDLRPDSG